MIQDYRLMLKREFEGRVERNRSYSLRAFARDLGLNPTRVSDIFRRKQGLSERVAEQILQKLGFKGEQAILFRTLVQAEHARSQVARESARLRLQKLISDPKLQMTLESFEVVSSWWHFAIVELTRVKGFKSQVPWIARRLGIRASEAKDAIKRLERVGLLKKEGRRWTATQGWVSTPSEINSDAMKRYHAAILAKANVALKEHPIAERDFSTVNVVISRDQITEAKELIKRFRREFVRAMEVRKDGEKVYSLSTQLFSLDGGES